MLAVTALAGPLLGAAAPATSTGWAASGSVDVTIDNQHIVTGELAKCTVDGPYKGWTQGGATGDIAVFGAGETGCGRTGEVSNAQATGRRFRATVLQRYGGPELSVRTFAAKCATTATGSVGEVSIGAVEGVTVPEEIPPNHRIVIPGGAAGTALATVVLNETVTPQPPDGSLVTHAVHIKLFPQGGPASGDIYLGTAACDPFATK
ncbi:choice-of-anchor P family protein [Amycolatopsis sp. A133]|uniref:choice-of-anchor P family protein n=1 Tax=Amycolatopsis sp. A133 TaxID=3064472 RepID=UPI0027E81621|nr:choice-of-anchor P family protein [Amycolatopsis sp. A133]MDQ7804986.1 choice-of-anchor P family protein [Amycolatopsis sp. A133]